MKILIFGSLPTSEGGRCSYSVVTEYLGRWLLAHGDEVIYVEFPWSRAELCAIGVAKCLRVLAEERPDATLYIGHPGSLAMLPPWPGPLAGLLTVEGPLVGELREHLPALDAVAAPSRFAANWISNYVRPTNGPVSVIPHGVDLEIFQPRRYERHDGPPRFLSVAANTPRKNLGNLILAFGQWRAAHQAGSPMAGAQLTLATNIIGVGGHLGEACHAAGLGFEVLEDRNAWASGHPVTFVGGWSEKPERLASLYRDSDWFVSATLAEGFCMPVLEAMASGLPCLLPRHTALADFPENTATWWEPRHTSWVAEYSQAFAAITVEEAIAIFRLSEAATAPVPPPTNYAPPLASTVRASKGLEHAQRNTWDLCWPGDPVAGRIGILGLFEEAIANYQQRRQP